MNKEELNNLNKKRKLAKWLTQLQVNENKEITLEKLIEQRQKIVSEKMNTTLLKKSFLEHLTKNDMLFLLHLPDSEYAWLFQNYNYLKVLDLEILGNAILLKDGLPIDENKYRLYKDNSLSNRSPDFIIENIENGEKIGIEVTTVRQLFLYRMYKDRNGTKEVYNQIKSALDAAKNQLKDIHYEEYTKIINKKINKIKNYETQDNILLVQTPYGFEIKNLNSKINFLIQSLLKLEFPNQDSKDKRFNHIVFSNMEVKGNLLTNRYKNDLNKKQTNIGDKNDI